MDSIIKMCINADSRLIPPDLGHRPHHMSCFVLLMFISVILTGYVSGYDTIQNPLSPTECHTRCEAKCEDVVAGITPSVWSIPEELLLPVLLPPDVLISNSEACKAYYCTTYLTDDWIQYCDDDPTCISNCLNLTTGPDDPEIPGRPRELELGQSSPYLVHLEWQSPARPLVFSVVNQIQEKISSRHSWQTINTTKSDSIDILVMDVCKEKTYRVEAYNQYGSCGSSLQIKRNEFPVPGPISVITTEIKFDEGYFFFEYNFTKPVGWLPEDVTVEIQEPIVPVYCQTNILPPFYMHQFTEGPNSHMSWLFRVYESAYNCVYKAQMRVISRCNTPGEYQDVLMDFTDCEKIEGYVCPAPPYISPGHVNNVTVSLVPDACNVTVSWERPLLEGSEGVSGYVVQWGVVQVDHLWPVVRFDEEGSVNVPGGETNASFCVEHYGFEYGVKIAAVDSVNYLQVNQTLAMLPVAEIFIVPNVTVTEPPGKKFALVNMVVPVVLSVVMAAVVLGTLGYMKWRRSRKPSELPFSVSGRISEGNKLGKQIQRCMVDNPFYETLDSMGFQPLTPPDEWEVPNQSLTLGAILGRGAFGQVVKGSLKLAGLELPGLNPRETSGCEIVVAVKMLHEYAGDTQRQDFVQEMDLMKKLGRHPNVVSMIGCCTQREPLCLVVEHVPNGDLLHYLRSHRQHMSQNPSGTSETRDLILTMADLLSFARQIAIGMEYLSRKGFVHRDLACRNVMVGEGRLVKIGDFGLTRYIYSDKLYVAGKSARLPLKWMAIEAMEEYRFTTETDVWSYGVVLFELVTLGGTPYPTIHNRYLLKELKTGYRMERPDNCTLELYRLMCSCWAVRPGDRPTFGELSGLLESMVERATLSTLYLDLCLDENREYYKASQSDDSEEESQDSDDVSVTTKTEAISAQPIGTDNASSRARDSGVIQDKASANESTSSTSASSTSSSSDVFEQKKPRSNKEVTSASLPILFHLQNSRKREQNRGSSSSTERLIPNYSSGVSSTTDSGSHSWLGETTV